jgi:hypothetical protein
MCDAQALVAAHITTKIEAWRSAQPLIINSNGGSPSMSPRALRQPSINPDDSLPRANGPAATAGRLGCRSRSAAGYLRSIVCVFLHSA